MTSIRQPLPHESTAGSDDGGFDVDDAIAAQIDANLDAAADFLAEVLADPARFATVPNGVALALAPERDPALADANRAMADRSVADGRRVVVVRY